MTGKIRFDFILFFEELIFKDLWWGDHKEEVERQDKEIKSKVKKWDELIAKTFEGFEIKRGEIVE